METFIIVGVVSLLVGIAGVLWAVTFAARRGFRRIKAGFTLCRSGFYVELADRRSRAEDADGKALAPRVSTVARWVRR